MTSGNNDNNLLSYTLRTGSTAAQVLAGKATIGPIGGDGATGDIGSVALDPTTGLYYVSSNGGNVEWDDAGNGTQIANGANEIRRFRSDPEHDWVYFSDQNGDPNGPNNLERFIPGTLVEQSRGYSFHQRQLYRSARRGLCRG